MMNVGIAGSFSEINRHTHALKKLQDIHVSGCWSMNGSPDSVMDTISGELCTDPGRILEKADVLVITDPGSFNNQLAVQALRNARHVFLYPSVVKSPNEVYQFIKLAREANVILKCARTGKFGINGFIRSIQDPHNIGMIEFRHIIKIPPEKTRTSIQEIVLGDMEILNRLIHARNTSIKAKGLCAFNAHPEILNARLEFDNGSAVNYYCNMVGMDDEHLITVMSKDSMLQYNLMSNDLSGWHLKSAVNQKENPIFIENIQVEQTDYLLDDLKVFFSLIHSGPAFLSIYDNGFESFVLTDRILEKVSKTLVQFA